MEIATYFSLFLVALSYGASACMFTCMPFLSPLLITNSSSISTSMSVLIPFSLGRIFTYTLISLISFYSSVIVKSIINNELISQLILGSTTIIIALVMLFHATKNNRCCTNSLKNSSSKIGYFFMGVGISINPCLPLMSLISLSINANEFYQALLFGIIFGIGVTSASFLIFGYIISKMAKGIVEEFSHYKNFIEKIAASALLVVGIFTLLGWMKL